MTRRAPSAADAFLQRERLHDAAADSAQHRAARLRGLRLMAVKILKDRNAQGAPARDRASIRAEMRPFLRASLHWLRAARAALRAGDVDRFGLLRDRARMYHAFAMLELFQPYANRQGERMEAIAALATRGGRAGARMYNRGELDDLIRGAIERAEPMQPKRWAADFGVALRTVYRRISAVSDGV